MANTPAQVAFDMRKGLAEKARSLSINIRNELIKQTSINPKVRTGWLRANFFIRVGQPANRLTARPRRGRRGKNPAPSTVPQLSIPAIPRNGESFFVTNNVEYAPYLALGTRHIKKRPYVEKAIAAALTLEGWPTNPNQIKITFP